MKFDDWSRVETIYHTALEKDGAERDNYVLRACKGDEILEGEVRSLIDAYESQPDFLDEPVRDLGLLVVSDESQASLTGETIGTYKIGKRLGKGGMGDVYLADDLKLDRQVAVKFLTAAFLNDNWAKRQLMHEAQAVAKLDHKNVCLVYGFENIDEHCFIVMQYIRGESLSNLIKAGTLESDSFQEIAEQIVGAIAAAHEHGIIHRDIKPGNIMLQKDGAIKVLDFGLAKIVRENHRSGDTAADLGFVTGRDSILGTPPYMSPEQIKGEKLDLCSDIFSIGTVLFELAASGVHPFAQKSEAETIAAIIDLKTPLDTLPWSKIPPNLRPVIRKCLEKEKKNRYQSTAELLLDLQNPPKGSETYFSTYRLTGIVALIIVVVLFAGAFLYFRTNRVYGVAVLPFANETADAGFDYLADGMAESLSQKLVGTNGFRSIAYSKLAGLTSADGNANLIGRNVQADLVLTGRIYRDAGALSLETTLRDHSDGSVLRLASQELNLGDIQTVESSLLERMFAGPEIRTFAELGNADRIAGRIPKPEAFQQYLIGRHHWRKRDRENIEKAIAAFQRAIDLDASYSQAWAGLADSFILQSSVAYGSTPAKDSFAKARAAAKEAIKIDPLNAEAHTSLGIVLTKQDWNWQEAEREYRIALEIDPEYGPAHFWYASLLGITGRRVESIASAEKAKELDPFSPLVEYNLARTYYYARQYDRALEVLNAQTAAPKNEEKILYMAGLIYLQKGMRTEALKVFQDVSAKNRMLGIAAVGYTYGRMGRRKEALNIIADLERGSTGSYIPPQELALIYIGLNERDKAFHYLNMTFEERYGAFTSLKVEPLFDPIRDDPRFAALLQQMALN